MSKKYTNSELKSILQQVLVRAYYNIDALSKELTKIKESDSKNMSVVDSTLPKEDLDLKARLYSNTILLINDIISPGHDISFQLFPKENHDFVKLCVSQQQKYAEACQKAIQEQQKQSAGEVNA